MTCVYDWFGLNCGDTVHAVDDPRHLGRVEAVNVNVKVRWLDNRFVSYLTREQLVVVEKARTPAPTEAPDRPRTVVESPRRRLERELRERR